MWTRRSVLQSLAAGIALPAWLDLDRLFWKPKTQIVVPKIPQMGLADAAGLNGMKWWRIAVDGEWQDVRSIVPRIESDRVINFYFETEKGHLRLQHANCEEQVAEFVTAGHRWGPHEHTVMISPEQYHISGKAVSPGGGTTKWATRRDPVNL